MSEAAQEKLNDDNLVGPGTRLRILREQLRMSVIDVAEKLHLDRSIIEDIENDDYSNMKRLVFVRGYLRSYARLLNTSPDSIINAFNRMQVPEHDSAAPVWAAQEAGMQIRIPGLRYAIVFGLLAGILVFAMKLFDTKSTTTSSAPVPSELQKKGIRSMRSETITLDNIGKESMIASDTPQPAADVAPATSAAAVPVTKAATKPITPPATPAVPVTSTVQVKAQAKSPQKAVGKRDTKMKRADISIQPDQTVTADATTEVESEASTD